MKESHWPLTASLGGLDGEVMNTNAGVWIDHREAWIVALTPEGETTSTILHSAAGDT